MNQGAARPILLIEDNPMDRDLTIRAFKKRRLANAIVVARDGEEALACVTQWAADAPLPVVILLDLKLPKVDGLEVLRHIKAHPQWRALPVVALTTSTETTDIEAAYQLGVNSYIVKPVDFDKFLEVAGQIDLYWLVLNTSPH